MAAHYTDRLVDMVAEDVHRKVIENIHHSNHVIYGNLISNQPSRHGRLLDGNYVHPELRSKPEPKPHVSFKQRFNKVSEKIAGAISR